MQRIFLNACATMTLLSAVAYGQSLADVARANREKQNATAKPAVITTDDVEALPPGGITVQPATVVTTKTTHSASQPKQDVDEQAAAQWKKQILAQKEKVTSLQAHIDQINSSIHPAGSAQFEGPSSRGQARQQERVSEIQLQLDEQKRKLTQLQEDARRAGMHTTTYDP